MNSVQNQKYKGKIQNKSIHGPLQILDGGVSILCWPIDNKVINYDLTISINKDSPACDPVEDSTCLQGRCKQRSFDSHRSTLSEKAYVWSIRRTKSLNDCILIYIKHNVLLRFMLFWLFNINLYPLKCCTLINTFKEWLDRSVR